MAAAAVETLPGPERHVDDLAIPSGIGANQGVIKNEHIQRLRPTPKDTPISEIRKRLKEDGYIFMKGLIPREDVLNLRKHYFQHWGETALLEPGTSPQDGIFNTSENPLHHGGIGAGDLPLSAKEVETLISSHHLANYLQFLENVPLRQMVRDIMGWEKEVLLRRTMLRHNPPGGVSTGIHYDKLFLRDGGAFFLTAWVPIGDVAANGGGLIYLSDSVPLGRAIEDDFSVRAAGFTKAERINAYNIHMHKFGILSNDGEEFLGREAGGRGSWLVGDYEAGDVVFHDPYMVHASGKNNDAGGRIRLSTDLRFYEEGSAMDERWMEYWTPGDGL
ncbi:hypothetical protein VE03_08862 [Pseudogymnoascus sp. 23342-1-I1]|nr:hypothetical protein VE03_08862 [Pseudogymnoascus sp. 23342-1-I1]